MDVGFFKWLVQFFVEHPTFIPFVLSLTANVFLGLAVKVMYTANAQTQKDTLIAIGKATETISTMNTLINLLVAVKGR